MSERQFKAGIRAEQQAYVRIIQERTGLTPTEIQREAGIKAASTLTRLMAPEGKHNLGAANHKRLVDRFGAVVASNKTEPAPQLLSDNEPLKGDDSLGEAELVSLWRRLKKPQKEIVFSIVEAAVKAFYNNRRYGRG